jgi:hypothetical protein
MSVPDGYREAVAADWETYSPMSEADVRGLLELVAMHDGREVTDSVVYGWGVESAKGNWDRETAERAVEAFFARPRLSQRLGPGFVTERITLIRRASRPGVDGVEPAPSTDRGFWLFILTVIGLAAIPHVPWIWLALRLPPVALIVVVLPVEFVLWALAVFVANRIARFGRGA